MFYERVQTLKVYTTIKLFIVVYSKGHIHNLSELSNVFVEDIRAGHTLLNAVCWHNMTPGPLLQNELKTRVLNNTESILLHSVHLS